MVSKNQQDLLPSGWNLQTKIKNGRKYKYYINATTHKKFYSKLSMLRYIKDECTSNEKTQHIDEHTKKTSGKNQMQLVQASDNEWLPTGWVVERRFRKSGARVGTEYRCFVDPSTGSKFFSKPEVLRYLGSKHHSAGLSRGKDKERSGHPSSEYIKDGCISNEKVQHINKHTKKTSGKNQMQLVQANDYEWLPTGWVVERRLRKSGPRVGTEYKCFIDQSTGSTFFSKPEVLRYLRSKQRSARLSREKDKKRSGNSSSERSVNSLNDDKSNLEAKVPQIASTTIRKGPGKLKVVVEKTVDEDLPSGWIKETRIKMRGNKIVRKDPFFVDPASRLVFRSKLDVLRYVESGEISRHAYRRRDGKSNGEDLAITISSGNKEDVSKSRSRKQNIEGEGSSGQSIKAPLKAGGQEKNGGKKNKPSSRIRSASDLKKNALSPESASDSQEKVEIKKYVGMSKYTTRSVQDVNAKDASLGKNEPSSVPSMDVISEENPLAVVFPDCNDKKVPTTKRKIKDGKVACMPLRSSKRLAGVDAEVVFLPVPIEHALRTSNRKPSRTRPIPIISNLGSVPNEKQQKREDIDGKDSNECAVRVTSRKKSKLKASPSLESAPKELHEKCQAADTNILNEEVLQPTGRRKSIRSELLPCSESSPDELHDKRKDVDKVNMHTSQGEPLVKRINDSDFKEVNHQIISDDEKSVLGIQVEQPLNKIETSLTYFEEQRQRLYQENSEIILASQGEPFYKIDDLPSQEMHHHSLDVDTKTVISTQGEPSSSVNDLITKRPILVDLNDLQLEAPPGFSENAKVGASTITMKQSFGHPVGTLLGSKVENTSKGKPTLEEKSGEQMVNTDKQTEQPESELCSLWSDPCLEFAYKTLTGAIPFDDNLAIQDYIQHQLSTSEQSLDICTPSFFRKDEPKLVSQLPEDVNLNSNSFASQRNQAGEK